MGGRPTSSLPAAPSWSLSPDGGEWVRRVPLLLGGDGGECDAGPGDQAGPVRGEGQVELPPWPDLVRHEVSMESERLGRRYDAPSLSPETAEGPHDRQGGTCRSLHCGSRGCVWGPGCQEESCVARGKAV